MDKFVRNISDNCWLELSCPQINTRDCKSSPKKRLFRGVCSAFGRPIWSSAVSSARMDSSFRKIHSAQETTGGRGDDTKFADAYKNTSQARAKSSPTLPRRIALLCAPTLQPTRDPPHRGCRPTGRTLSRWRHPLNEAIHWRIPDSLAIHWLIPCTMQRRWSCDSTSLRGRKLIRNALFNFNCVHPHRASRG